MGEKQCTLITFNEKHTDEEIIQLFMVYNKTTIPLSKDGCNIKNEGIFKGMTHLSFENKNDHIFIIKGKIYCDRAKNWIMEVLESSDINYNSMHVNIPLFISSYFSRVYIPREKAALKN